MRARSGAKENPRRSGASSAPCAVRTAPAGLSLAGQRLYLPTMPFPTMPNRIANRESEAARRHPDPERETLELATAGAAKVLGPDHGVTQALANASITMAKADLWRGSGTTIT